MLRDDVEVHMHDDLMGGAAVVLEHVVGRGARDLKDCTAEPWEHAPEGRGALLAQLMQMGLPLLGDEQEMSTTQRSDVKKGERVRILMDPVAGDLTIEDAIEDRGHGRSVQEPSRLLAAESRMTRCPWRIADHGGHRLPLTLSFLGGSLCDVG